MEAHLNSGVHVFPDISVLSHKAALMFVELSRPALASRGRYSVAISGGATPRTLFRLMASEPYRGLVDWGRVHFFWADERCVPVTNEESNYGSAYGLMLSKLPVPASNIHRIKGELGPEAAAGEYARELKDFFGEGGGGYFDLIFLGVGEDGHTASLFPGSGALSGETRAAVPVYVERLKSWRVTLTLHVINGSANVVFIVAGPEKAHVVSGLLGGGGGGGEGGGREGYPAGLVSPRGGRLFWLIDAAAAAGLAGRTSA